MGQDNTFQLQTAPEQFYTTSYENEVAYVTPGGSHQNTEFINNNQLVQTYTKKEGLVAKPPVSGGLWFFLVLIAVWQIGKTVIKKCRKTGPILLLSLLCYANVAARDVVWKHSFIKKNIRDGRVSNDSHLEGKCSNKTLHYYNTLNQIQKITYTQIDGAGLRMSNIGKGASCAEGDIIEQSKYSKLTKVTIRYQFLGSRDTANYIYLRNYNETKYNKGRLNYSEDTQNKHKILPGDSIWTVNIDTAQNGILIHFTLYDSILLKSIEIEYEDTSATTLNNYKFYDERNELVYAFADTATETHTLTTDTMPVAALKSNDWIYAGWSDTTYYNDTTATPITVIGGSATADTVFRAIYNHTRKAGSPIGVTDESRYYSHYCITDTMLDEEGYNTSEDVMFPDGVRYKISNINESRFYYFSLPFDCPLSHIKFSNPAIHNYVSGIENDAYIGDWLITYWDESTFSWVDIMNVDLANTILTAGNGYGIGIIPSVTTDVYFISDYNQTISPLHNDTIPISFTYPVAGDTSGRRSGWNFMGSRLWQPIDYTAINTSYVLIANTEDFGWTLYSPYDETLDSSWTIKPFSTFMVQTNRDLTYTVSQPQAIAAESIVDHFNLVIRQGENPERMDYTTIVSGSEYSDEYEIGMDMSKMITQDVLPQIYSVMDSTYYAINASGFDVGSKIKVGIYVPHKEDWVISLGRNINIPEGWHIILKDKSTGVKKDLTVDDYQFNLKKGFYPNRFELEISDMPLIVEDIVSSDGEPQWMRIVSVSGIVVYEGAYDWTRLEGLREGVYVVVTDKWVRKMMVKR